MKQSRPQKVCDVLLCKYDIVKEVLKSRGYQQCKMNDSNWNVFWIDTGVSLERVLAMSTYQKINHFPGMDVICVWKFNLRQTTDSYRKECKANTFRRKHKIEKVKAGTQFSKNASFISGWLLIHSTNIQNTV